MSKQPKLKLPVSEQVVENEDRSDLIEQLSLNELQLVAGGAAEGATARSVH